jgi:hypothetical protein
MAIGSPNKAARLGQLEDYAYCLVASGYRSIEQIRVDLYDAAVAEERGGPAAAELTRRLVAAALERHEEESATWPEPTSYDRLQLAFADLRAHDVVVLEAVDDHWAASEALARLAAEGMQPRGVAFFTPADVWHSVQHGMLELNVWHGTTANVAPGDDLLDLVVDTLAAHGVAAHFGEGRIEAAVRWQRRAAHAG